MLLFLLVKTASDSRNNISLDSLLNSYYFRFFLAFCLISCRHSHQHARKCIVLSFTLSHSKRSLTPTKWNKKQSVKNNSTKTTHGKSLASESRGLNLDTTTTTTSETICVQQEKKSARKRENYNTAFFTNISFFSSILDRTWRSPQQCRLITSDSRIFFFLRLSFAEGSSLLH